ncbi:MAG: hypothetical protein HQ559_03120, partial [Lentisphaerae bacterium]|nr:hypothetical protein [Lentisphaerota bacterium]
MLVIVMSPRLSTGHLRCVLVMAFVFGILASSVLAAPYEGKRFTYHQPDGSTFTVRLWGDEFFAYQETENGYLVKRDPKSGAFRYAATTKNGFYLFEVRHRDTEKPVAACPRLVQ